MGFIEKYKQNVEKTINLFGGIRKKHYFCKRIISNN